MTEAILAIFAALMIFFVLTEILTIKIFLGENYIVEINFIVFAVVFKRTKSYNKRRKINGKRRRTNSFFSTMLIISLLRKSYVKIKRLIVYLPDKAPNKNALRFGLYNGIVFSFLAFLENNAKFFEALNITLSYSEHNNLKKELEAEFKISLLDVLITTVSFYFKEAYYRIYRFCAKRIVKDD